MMQIGASHAYHFGLLGYPLGHSLSPLIHRQFLSGLGLKGEYSLYTVPPGDMGALQAILRQMKDGEIDGLNVTIPYKRTVLSLLDELTPTARAIGAVNTIFRQGGSLTGENTDAPGFLLDLRQLLGETVPSQALVLGAGGSARAVIQALQEAGWQVWVAARRVEQAEELAIRFPCVVGTLALRPASLAAAAPQPALMVNTTPVGMSPNDRECPWPEEVPLPPGAAVYDLVYNPVGTRLMQRAIDQGLPARGGLGMLVEQAALAFKCWTGSRAPSIDPNSLVMAGL